MANKNRELIVAYFDSADAADAAAVQLKQWDKDRKDIKLGGMGIITMEDGELKTDKVGARATGTGAKWGTILGAAGGLAAGLLTGGIGLIPGAIAGLGLGAGGGALFHKRVGLTDEDREKLMNHFQSGGAALAVMADDFEVADTTAEIAALGGDVTSFSIPEHVQEEIDEAQETIAEAEKRVAEAMPDAAEEAQVEAVRMVSATRDMSIGALAGLTAAGVTSIDTLQEKAATAEGRAELVEAAGLDKAAVRDIAYDLDLGRVRGVGRKSRELLQAAGITSVGELAEWDADELAGLLVTVNEEENIVQNMPSEETLSYWIEQARELPPYLRAIKVVKDMMNVDAYSWSATEGDDPTKRRADAIMFNRKEGYEVQLMVQKICDAFGFESVEDAKRVEDVIANELPGNVRSQKNVYAWLVEYFDTH